MNGHTYKVLLVLVALSVLLGGAFAMDSRFDAKNAQAIKPLAKDIAEIKTDIKTIMNHLRVWK